MKSRPAHVLSQSFLKFALVFLAAVFGLLLSSKPSMAADTYQYVTHWGGSGSSDTRFAGANSEVIDASGNIYVLDVNNYAVKKFTSDGNFVTKWSDGWGGFTQLQDMAIDSSGIIYVLEGNPEIYPPQPTKIQKFKPDGTLIGEFAAGKVSGAFIMTVDSNDNVLLGFPGSSTIKKLSKGGTLLKSWSGRHASGLVTDGAGNLYVASHLTNTIKKYSPTGSLLTSWGGSGSANGKFGANGPTAMFIKSGELFVSDRGNGRIQVFDLKGNFKLAFGSSGSGDAKLAWPEDVVVDTDKNVYVVDINKVKKFSFAPGTPTVKLITPFVSTRISKSTTFKVRWSAQTSSGVKSYTVRYRPSNSSVWRTWKNETKATYAYFAGKAGVTYYFRVKAEDNLGNIVWSKAYKTIVPFNEGIFLRQTGFLG